MDHVLETMRRFTHEAICEEDFAAVVFKGPAERGRPVRLWKYLGYHYADGCDPAEVRSQVAWTLDRAKQSGFAAILEQQEARALLGLRRHRVGGRRAAAAAGDPLEPVPAHAGHGES